MSSGQTSVEYGKWENKMHDCIDCTHCHCGEDYDFFCDEGKPEFCGCDRKVECDYFSFNMDLLESE